MNLRHYLLFMVALLVAGCNRAPKNNEAIRQAIIDHLSKRSGLDVSAMNVEVTAVTYRGDEADATVSFKPKAMPNEQGMSMNYTLESKGGHWTVKRKAGSAAHAGAEAGGLPPGGMPPGHPSAGAGGAGAVDMPPGNPAGAQPGASGQMPPGHPPVSGTTKSGEKK